MYHCFVLLRLFGYIFRSRPLILYLIFFSLFQYHGKLVKLWDKYNCSSKDKAKQGCPKSQSFYAATPHHSGLAGNLNNLVHVSHNPETNLTTTNVASPQTPKTHTLSTESSRVSGKFMYLQIIILLQASTQGYFEPKTCKI